MSDEWFSAVCWSSLLFRIFMIKKWVEFSLTSFGTLKYAWVIKRREMFNFLHLINSSVIIEFGFLLLISAMISSKTINILRSLSVLHSSIFSWTSCISFEYSLKALESLKCFNLVLSLLLIKNLCLASYGSLVYKYISSTSGCLFIKFNNAFVFLDSEPIDCMFLSCHVRVSEWIHFL